MTQMEDGEQMTGNYVVGWIKRGPSGVIGTNRPDSVETVEMLLEDLRDGKLLNPSQPQHAAIETLLQTRKPAFVTFADWLQLDQLEQERGREVDRPRVKFSDVGEMLAALKKSGDLTPGD